MQERAYSSAHSETLLQAAVALLPRRDPSAPIAWAHSRLGRFLEPKISAGSRIRNKYRGISVTTLTELSHLELLDNETSSTYRAIINSYFVTPCAVPIQPTKP